MRVRFLGAAIVGVLALSVPALASSPAGLTQLKTREIAKLLKGGVLLRAKPCVPGRPYTQEERIDGRGIYRGYDDIVSSNGEIVVEDGKLCVIHNDHTKSCRVFYRDKSGGYWQELDLPPGSSRSLKEIEFLSIETPINCAKEVLK